MTKSRLTCLNLAKKMAMRRGLSRMLNSGLAKGWGSWYGMVLERQAALEAMRRSIAFMINTSLVSGMMRWRGVAAGILPTALNRLMERGARREDLVIALGPAVSGQHYQVGEEVVEAIAASIPPTLASAPATSRTALGLVRAVRKSWVLGEAPMRFRYAAFQLSSR